jgi:hypothetical protein
MFNYSNPSKDLSNNTIITCVQIDLIWDMSKVVHFSISTTFVELEFVDILKH